MFMVLIFTSCDSQYILKWISAMRKKKKKIKNCNLDNAAICYKFEVSKNYKVHGYDS